MILTFHFVPFLLCIHTGAHSRISSCNLTLKFYMLERLQTLEHEKFSSHLQKKKLQLSAKSIFMLFREECKAATAWKGGNQFKRLQKMFASNVENIGFVVHLIRSTLMTARLCSRSLVPEQFIAARFHRQHPTRLQKYTQKHEEHIGVGNMQTQQHSLNQAVCFSEEQFCLKNVKQSVFLSIHTQNKKEDSI